MEWTVAVESVIGVDGCCGVSVYGVDGCRGVSVYGVDGCHGVSVPFSWPR